MGKEKGEDFALVGGAVINKRIRVGLAGNPNSGKTTLFNELTGSHQKVGNWPGVTVEVKTGTIYYEDYEIELTDLPGTYSISTISNEERIARDYILDYCPDIIIQVVEGPNIERNLYLTTQLIELEVPLILALNMYDEVKEKGIKIRTKKLSALLGMPVIPTVGKRGKGVKRLLEAVAKLAGHSHKPKKPVKINYGHEYEGHIDELIRMMNHPEYREPAYPSRWLALGLIEGDDYISARMHLSDEDRKRVMDKATGIRNHLTNLYHIDPKEYIADQRYGFVSGALKETFKHRPQEGLSVTHRIDDILTNRILGLPILFFLMWLLFQATFGLGQYPVGWIEAGIGFLSGLVSSIFPTGPVKDLLVDGLIGGVGSVIVFLPNILILFLGISILEDSGYMARAAFVTDRVMHALGLHGKSFVPMVMGFGCSVPAIMATRMLESRRDRLLTMLIIPLMSCSARLPIYILFAGTFFPNHAGNIIFGLYLFGIFCALVIGRLFSSLFFHRGYSPFVMELPSYRMPTARSIVFHMWHRVRIYLKKMGGIILVGSLLLWFLGAYPKPPDKSGSPMISDNGTVVESGEGLQKSSKLEFAFIGQLGRLIEPTVQPLGFDWKMGVSLLSGFVAKEVVVSSMGVLYSAENHQSSLLQNALVKSGITPLVAVAFIVFSLLYTPCLATVGAIFRESGSKKWTALSIIYQSSLAWLAAFVIYQGGKVLGLG